MNRFRCNISFYVSISSKKHFNRHEITNHTVCNPTRQQISNQTSNNIEASMGGEAGWELFFFFNSDQKLFLERKRMSHLHIQHYHYRHVLSISCHVFIEERELEKRKGEESDTVSYIPLQNVPGSPFVQFCLYIKAQMLSKTFKSIKASSQKTRFGVWQCRH